MNVEQVISALGYDRSPHFLRGDDLNAHPAFSHVFRRAEQESGLRGVYVLQDAAGNSLLPTVYVCEALDEDEARKIHRRVWNQNVVPFLLVVTRQDIRVYPGFAFEVEEAPERRLETLIKLTSEALAELDAFRSEAIDQGELWSSRWGQLVTPEERVDWQLLEQLKRLSRWLQGQGLRRSVAHALIGKYVYLHYLRDREILSAQRLAGWRISPTALFGRGAEREMLFRVIERLDDWLNGAVFPLDATDAQTVSAEHIRMVAGVFSGDLVDEGQLHLDFRRYDFARIPIETLSVVYEQFLHEDERGRESGAYYTPLHLVNFMLDELEAKRPLSQGMRVLDPACGSGAFLVQCYRRLIEREQAGGKRLRPAELRDLLTLHIFGVDQDRDACQVAGLSLMLTLLDYVEPPDLVRYPSFKVPDLFGHNIIEGDFFQIGDGLSSEGFDWIVSNPPWRDLKSRGSSSQDRAVFDWMRENRERQPVGGHQMAEAFAWKVTDHGKPDGAVAMLVPAMTLFKSESVGFRRRFFEQFDVWAVANFANLSQVLFKGRSEVPAAALFYGAVGNDTKRREFIDTFAPFLMNQSSQIGSRKGRQTWNIVINGGEVRQVSLNGAMSGAALPWKVAMWGSHRDARLIGRVARRFPSLREFRGLHGLALHEGPQLRSADSAEHVEFVEELVGKKYLDVKVLGGKEKLFSLPIAVFQSVNDEIAYVRKKGGVRLPLSVCRPPHLFVDQARRFAIFSDKFFVIPSAQVGISGDCRDAETLKALALLINSDFARYHQFFSSIQWGVQKNIANKENLEALPIPLDRLSPTTLEQWVELHDALADIDDRSYQESEHFLVLPNEEDPNRQALIAQINEFVFDALQITSSEHLLIQDLVHGRMGLLQGKVDKTLMQAPGDGELIRHANILLSELNNFLAPQLGLHHHLRIHRDVYYSVLEITLDSSLPSSADILVTPVSESLSGRLRQLREQLGPRHDQWLYFERKLTLFDGPRTYLLKPMQRLQWLPSQALLDADSLIADTLAATGSDGGVEGLSSVSTSHV